MTAADPQAGQRIHGVLYYDPANPDPDPLPASAFCPHTARDGHSRCGRLLTNGRHDGFHAPGNGSGRRR